MRVLAVDTATTACSAALWDDGHVVARRHRVMARGQSEALLPMVAEIMAEAGLDFTALDLLAVTVGPGAFTGIRIGLAAARGLALATGLPLAGLSTTEAVAAAVPPRERDGRHVLAVMESKREELWAQPFSAELIALAPPAAVAPAVIGRWAAARPTVLAGDAAARVAELAPGALLSSVAGWPDAAWVAERAVHHWRLGTALPPEPLYLRPADVTMPAGLV